MSPEPKATAARRESRALRSVLGHFATGIIVVAAGRETPCGMTANAFTSVSLDPPLILVCINRTASMYKAVLDCGHFTVSVLSAGQEHLARYFADYTRPRGAEEFGAVEWSPGPWSGAPVLKGSLAWLDCELTTSYAGGDHEIFLGSVVASGFSPSCDALVFYRGGFHQPPLARPREPEGKA
jgi:flavin reductase (DIM6/NTAB) family NADH-FMN oxidoreductase RutF